MSTPPKRVTIPVTQIMGRASEPRTERDTTITIPLAAAERLGHVACVSAAA